jgi:hypothetical protein
MELPKEAVHDSCSGRIQNPNMLDLKATDNQTGQMVKHICLTKKENKDQPEADASARVPAEVDGATPVESQNPPAGTSADVLPGVAKACQEVASGLDFPENYGEIPDTIEDRTSAYCKRSRFYRRGPAIFERKMLDPGFYNVASRKPERQGYRFVLSRSLRRDPSSTDPASRRWSTPIWTSVLGLLLTRVLVYSD